MASKKSALYTSMLEKVQLPGGLPQVLPQASLLEHGVFAVLLESLAPSRAESALNSLRKAFDDWNEARETILRVDGGMVASDWTMQRLSDLVNAEVDRPHIMETTALGAAWLAGQQAGFYADMDTFAKHWQLETRFTPKMDEAERAHKYAGWKDAVRRTLSEPK